MHVASDFLDARKYLTACLNQFDGRRGDSPDVYVDRRGQPGVMCLSNFIDALNIPNRRVSIVMVCEANDRRLIGLNGRGVGYSPVAGAARFCRTPPFVTRSRCQANLAMSPGCGCVDRCETTEGGYAAS